MLLLIIISTLVNNVLTFHSGLFPQVRRLPVTTIHVASENYKPYSKSYGGSGGDRKPYGRSGGGDRGRSSFGGGGGRAKMDQSLKLRFTKTVKIDPESKTPIEEMNFSPKTLSVLQAKGFTEMTPVQSQSYDLVYSGADVVARSKTGTGKTFAFGIPLIEKIVAQNLHLSPRENLPLILVIEPTRELAVQVAQELSSICSVHKMRVEAIYGGASMTMQERSIRSGLHIIVATPGRALDLISRGAIDLSHVKHVVLDEGDTMLEMGFQKDVESILLNVKAPGKSSRNAAAKNLKEKSRDSDRFAFNDFDEDDDADADFDEQPKQVNNDVQMLLFSATMPGWICSMTDKHMVNPIFLDAVQEGDSRLSDTISHFAIKLPSYNRFEAVKSYLEDLILTKSLGGQTIVFTNTKEEADTLLGSDSFGRMRALVLHGDISQNTRQTTIRQFKDRQIDVLIATDVAARGLDISGVDLVVHTAPPFDADTFVHRSGRTGRAGRNGTSILLYSSVEERKLYTYERELNFNFKRTGPPSSSEISEASALYASKRITEINPQVVKHFVPHAKGLINTLYANNNENDDDSENENNNTEFTYTPEQIEDLVARCLAAISNKNTITCRSLLTGENDVVTLEIEAVFKNGTSPDNVRDWQRLIAGVLRGVLNLQDVRFGKTSMARGVDKNIIALVDFNKDRAYEILEEIEKTELPVGISFKICDTLPPLIVDRSERPSYSSSSSGGYSGGGYRGGGGGGGGSGRSYGGRGSYGGRDSRSDSPRGSAGGGSSYDGRSYGRGK
eukprot:gene9150-12341_t